MSKQEEKVLIPALRFPEFQDSGSWKQLPIGKKVGLLSGYPFKSSEISEDASGIPLMRGINITEGVIRHSKDMDRYYLGNTEGLEKYFLQTDDLVIGMDGSKVGKNSALVTGDDAGSLLIQRVARLRTTCKATISFVFQHIHSIKFHSYVDRINTSGGIPHISAKQINEFEISFPPVEKEQQKIADCLTSIDELITAQTQKLDALKAHKKGLMQQLFPAKGKTQPKLRFPEFRDKGEWNPKKLEKLANRGSGHTPNKKMPSYYNGGIKWVSLADSKKLDNGYIYDTKVEISKEGIENSSAVLHPAGTVILSRDAGVGKSAVLYSDMAVSQHFIAWVCDESELSHWFLYYVLQTLKPSFERIAVGNTIKTIGLPYFREMHISIPSPEEQQKIADCLTSIDDLITTQTQKIDTLKTHKKGLMQQLFPTMDDSDQ